MKEIFVFNLVMFTFLLLIESFSNNWVYAWIDLRLLLVLLIVNFILYLIFINKTEKNYE